MTRPADAPEPRRTLQRRYATLAREPGDPDAPFYITTNDLDHMQDRLFPEGADLSAYLKNPVVLWLHDAYGFTGSSGMPVATSKGLELVAGKGIRCTGLAWLEEDAFAARVKNAWEQGVVRAASVGFFPVEWDRNADGGYDITRWKLLEFSLVPVPANPHAVRVAGKARAVRSPGELVMAVKAAGAAPPVLELLSGPEGGSAKGFGRRDPEESEAVKFVVRAAGASPYSSALFETAGSLTTLGNLLIPGPWERKDGEVTVVISTNTTVTEEEPAGGSEGEEGREAAALLAELVKRIEEAATRLEAAVSQLEPKKAASGALGADGQPIVVGPVEIAALLTAEARRVLAR